MNTNGFDNLDRKRYDARADRLFIPMFFIVDFLFYLYFCGGIGEEKTPDVLITLVIGLAFTLIGTFDFLQSEGASKNGIYFWGILWFAGAGLISATAMSPLNQALCALLIIVAKFLVYAGGVQILFSGYNHQIKAWMITVIFIVSGFTELRVLLFVPECLLLYLCICNRKSLPSWVSPRVYKVAMGILILNIAVVLTGMVYGLLSDTGEDPFFWGLVWAIVALFLIEILFFSVLYRGILKKRDEQFIGDNQFTLIFTVAGIIATGLLYRYGLTLNECVFSVFLFTFAILLYKFVEAVFKTDKWQNRKNLADLQFESGIKRDRDSADFLHDEVLQDLYAVKLLTQNFGETGENAKEVNEILSNLQFRIRGELEASGMNKEKSFSFKDNIRIMLAGLQKRFCEKKMEIVFDCSENFIIYEPLDRRLYYFIRELVINAFKHGGDRCEISLQRTASKILLEVSSNGEQVSAEEKEILSKGFGLASMREQVFVSGGKFELRKNPEGGLRILIEMKGD